MDLDLTTKISEKITLLDVRNCFKTIGFDHVPLIRMITLIYEKQIKKSIDQHIYNGRREAKRRCVIDFLRESECEPYGLLSTKINYTTLLGKTHKIIDELVSMELIERDSEHYSGNEHYSVTKSGHSLRMQKNLKRIPLERANGYLRKLLTIVKKINSENLFLSIDAVLLFGSVTRKAPIVGDIDLSVVIERRDYCCENDIHYRVIDTETKKIMKLLRISPYMSFTPIYNLTKMFENGDCDINLVYSNDKFSLKSLKTTPALTIKNAPTYPID
jgi:predicted nucleotidyltransferase/predicted transcriptional regulator